MSKAKTFSPDLVDEMMQKFKGLKEPKRPLNAREFFDRKLAPTAIRRLDSGEWVSKDVHAAAAEVGIDEQPATINRWIKEYRRNKKRRRNSKTPVERHAARTLAKEQESKQRSENQQLAGKD